MEVPRLGVKWELQLSVYTTAKATPDPEHICKLHHNLWQHQIFNPMSEARNRTHILIETSRVLNPLSHNMNSPQLNPNSYCYQNWFHRTELHVMMGIWTFCSHEFELEGISGPVPFDKETLVVHGMLWQLFKSSPFITCNQLLIEDKASNEQVVATR